MYLENCKSSCVVILMFSLFPLVRKIENPAFSKTEASSVTFGVTSCCYLSVRRSALKACGVCTSLYLFLSTDIDSSLAIKRILS